MADNCPALLANPATVYVGGAHSTFMELALGSYALAQDAVNDIESFTITPIEFTPQFNVTGSLTPFRRPEKPEAPDVSFNDDEIPDPGTPPTFDGSVSALTNAPTFNEPAPTIAPPPRPGALNVADPGDAPFIPDREVPEAPEIEDPLDPVLLDITIPEAPDISFPTFLGERPDFDGIAVPQNVFSFSPQEYQSELATRIGSRIKEILDTGSGLPELLDQALRDKALSEIDKSEQRTERTAWETFAARGFSIPNGILVASIQELRQEAQNRRSAASRDIYIDRAQRELKALEIALTNGVAWEGVLVRAHVDQQQLLLESAKYAVDVVIRIFDAQVTLKNAQYQAYAVDAQVHRDLIQAELAKVQVFQAEIQAEQLKEGINEQRIRILAERIRAILAKVEVFKARVAAVEAQARVDGAKIDAYRGRVQAYAERLRAHVAEWDGYKAGVDAELAKVSVFEVLARAFGTRTSAWQTEQTTKLERDRIKATVHGEELATYRAKLERARVYIERQTAKVGSTVDIFRSLTQLYAAETGVETAAAEQNRQNLEIALRKEEARVNILLRNAEMSINQMIQASSLMLRAHETIAQVLSQLSASSMSAVNYSAGVASSVTESKSCSTSFSFQGDIES